MMRRIVRVPAGLGFAEQRPARPVEDAFELQAIVKACARTTMGKARTAR